MLGDDKFPINTKEAIAKLRDNESPIHLVINRYA